MKSKIPISTLAAILALSGANTTIRADEGWAGGDGTWDFNNTPNWTNPGPTWTTNNQQAYFQSAPGTITVDNSKGQVGDNQLAFYGTGAVGNWDIKGGDLAVDGSQNGLLYNSFNTGSVTIDSNMFVDTTRPTDRYNIFDSTGYTGNNTFNGPGGVINLNGNITFTGALDANKDNVNRSLIIGSSTNNTVINLNGVFSDSSASGGPGLEIRFGEGGADHMNYYVNGNVSGMSHGLSIGEGNVNIGASANLGTHGINIYNDQGVSGQNAALYGTQGVTISNFAYLSAKYDFGTGSNSRYGSGTEGVSDNSAVTFSGGTGLDSTSLILDAASGGRATFTSNIGGAAPTGLSKTGTGTVVFATSNNYNTFADGRDNANAGTVAMDIKEGTLLITNTSGSAFGSGNQNGSTPDTTVVKIENGAKLGGSGISTQKVVTAAGGSVIAPGDSAADHGTVTISTLTLAGGMDATNGLTMNFKLDRTNNDAIDFANAMITLSGVVTINLTGTPTPDTGSGNFGIFTLLANIGVGSTSHGLSVDTLGSTISTDPAIIINAPTGYVVESSGYYPDNGSASGDSYYVQLEAAAVPEPSTYGLMALSMLALLAIRRFRRLSA